MRLGKGEGGAGWGGAIKSPGGASKAVPLLNRMIIFIVLFLDDDKRPSMIMCIEIHVLLSMCVAHVCVCVFVCYIGGECPYTKEQTNVESNTNLQKYEVAGHPHMEVSRQCNVPSFRNERAD